MKEPILSNLYHDQDAIRRFKRKLETGQQVFIEIVRGPGFQSIYEVIKADFHLDRWGHGNYTVAIRQLKLGDKLVDMDTVHLSLYSDLRWREDATESKWVKVKDQVAPTFMDKLGQLVEKGDLIVASNRDGSLEIGQFTRVTPKGTVFIKRVDGGDEFKLYQAATMGSRNTGLLKLTRDLREQIMLLKLSS